MAQQYVDDSGKVKIVIVKDPYTDTRTGAEIVKGPDLLENGGLKDTLKQLGCEIVNIMIRKKNSGINDGGSVL